MSESPPSIRWTLDDGSATRRLEISTWPFRVGRDPGCDLVLSGQRVSREHAEFSREGREVFVRDLGSSNGTSVNGEPLTGPVAVQAGDIVSIGEATLRREFEPRSVRGRGSNPAVWVAVAGAAVVAIVLFALGTKEEPGGSPREDGTATAEAEKGSDTPPGSEETPSPREQTGQVSETPAFIDPTAPFAEALEAGRLVRAERLLGRLGHPSDLQARLEEAVETRAATIVSGLDERVAAEGRREAARWLRGRLDELPPESDARRRLTARVFELQLAAGGAVAEGSPKPTPGGAGPEAEADTPETAQGAGAGEEATAEAPATPADTEALAALETADELLKARRFEEAKSAYAEIARTWADAGPSRHATRAREGLEAVREVEDLITAISGAIDSSRGGSIRLSIARGHRVALVRADLEGLHFASDRHLPWAAVPARILELACRRLSLEPREVLIAADILRRDGVDEVADELLTLAYEKNPDVKGRIDRHLARARGFERVPEGGFTLREGDWLSPAEVARHELNAKIDTAVASLRSSDAREREAAFETLLALGELTRSRLRREIDAIAEEQGTRTAKLPSMSALRKVVELRAELDAAREHALALIFDTEAYPYPYKPPRAPQEALVRYQESQPEVDRRVAAIREIWEGPVRVPIASAVREAAVSLREIKSWRKRAGFDPRPVEPEWVLFLPDASHLTLQNVALSLAEREALDRSVEVMALNESASPEASVGEIDQARITNEYRLMMGRPAVRIFGPLREAAASHCQDMMNHGFFSHSSPLPGRESPSKRAAQAGAKPFGLGENIALAGGPQGAHNGWVHSPGHHRNILNPRWRLMGPGNAGRRWCQLFSAGDASLQDDER